MTKRWRSGLQGDNAKDDQSNDAEDDQSNDAEDDQSDGAKDGQSDDSKDDQSVSCGTSATVIIASYAVSPQTTQSGLALAANTIQRPALPS
jgi:hypothetical protein